MANDFSGDSDCVALWKFDNNANDSIGGNDLTEQNSPTYDSTNKKEGTHAIDFERSSSQYCSLADTSLDAGFPGKNGTSEQSFSICCWIRSEDVTVNGGIVSKYDLNKMSYKLNQYNDDIRLHVGYNNGESQSYITFATTISVSKWYHIGATYDSSDNSMKLRIWDDDAGALLDSNQTGTAGGDMFPDDAQFEIGRTTLGANLFDGIIDEVVIFKRALSDDDIDAIRAGIFPLATPQAVGSGSIAIAGTISTLATYLQSVGSGSISIAGSALKKLWQSIGGGAITPSGALSAVQVFGATVGGGAIAIAGALSRVPTWAQAVGSGAIAIASTLAKIPTFAQSVGQGSIAIAGSLAKIPTFIKAVGSGVVAIAGSLAHIPTFIQLVGYGSIAIASTLIKKTLKPVGAGTVTISSSLLKRAAFAKLTVFLHARSLITKLRSR